MAVLILGLLAVGLFMGGMEFSPLKLQVYGLHKSLGILVLMLGTLRLGWRFLRPPPPELETHRAYEKFLSKIIHVVLYGAIFAMPLSGWVMSSAGDFPVGFFGLFELPDLTAKDEALFKLSKQVHEILAYAVIGAVGLHMLGALKHHFIDKDATLQRMTRDGLGSVGGILTALFFGGALMLSVVQVVEHYFSSKTYPEEEFEVVVAEPIDKVSNDEVGLWNVVLEQSHIKFTATQYGQDFQGSFDFEGEIVFDPDDLENAYVRIEIDTGSIRTGAEDRDGQALEDEWFATSDYPQAVFEAGEFKAVGANQYETVGSLTIRDVTRDLVLPFSLEIEGDRAQMKAQLSLNRLDFGVGQGQWSSGEAIGSEVRLDIFVSAIR